jgi:hypothetical protein
MLLVVLPVVMLILTSAVLSVAGVGRDVGNAASHDVSSVVYGCAGCDVGCDLAGAAGRGLAVAAGRDISSVASDGVSDAASLNVDSVVGSAAACIVGNATVAVLVVRLVVDEGTDADDCGGRCWIKWRCWKDGSMCKRKEDLNNRSRKSFLNKIILKIL